MGAGIDSTAFIHESAVVDGGAVVGPGCRVWHFCHVMAGARIGARCVLGQNVFVGGSVVMGDGCKIQNNVSLYDGVQLEADVFVGPSAVFTNVTTPRAFISRQHEFRITRVGRGATIGANATVVCGRHLGAYCFVAAGAVVTRDVAPYALVAGVPARRRGWVCHCGESLIASAAPSDRQPIQHVDWACPSCSARFRVQVTAVGAATDRAEGAGSPSEAGGADHASAGEELVPLSD